MNYDQWSRDFLAAIGAPSTPQNLAFMNAWIAKESGSYPISYGWNPLNTTQSAPGSYGGGAQGNIQFFPDYRTGLAANVKTITNGLYGDLLSELRGGNPSTSAPYRGLQTWGTGSLSGVSGSPNNSTTSSTSSGSTSSTSSGSTSSTSSGSAPSWWPKIPSDPLGIGAATQNAVSVAVVTAFALVALGIGGIWLIMGNESTRTIATNTAKAATKAAAIAA